MRGNGKVTHAHLLVGSLQNISEAMGYLCHLGAPSMAGMVMSPATRALHQANLVHRTGTVHFKGTQTQMLEWDTQAIFIMASLV